MAGYFGKPTASLATLQRGHPLARGLALAYTFGDRAGSRVIDGCGARHGTLGTGFAWPGTLYGGGLQNTNTSGSQRLSWSPLASGTTFTIAVRFLTTGGATYRCLCSNNNATTAGLFITTSKLNYYYSGNHLSTTTLSSSTWYDAVFSVTAGAGTFYLNGVADGTCSSVPTANLQTSFSDTSYSDYFTGTLDYLYVWVNRALSANDVIRLKADPFAMFRRRLILPGAASPATGPFADANFFPGGNVEYTGAFFPGGNVNF